MDISFVLKTVSGHVARLLIPLLTWGLVKAGMEAAEADPFAAQAAELLAGLLGVLVSVAWSLWGRKRLRDAPPPK